MIISQGFETSKKRSKSPFVLFLLLFPHFFSSMHFIFYNFLSFILFIFFGSVRMLALVGVVAEASSGPCQQLPTVFYVRHLRNQLNRERVREACWRVASILCEWGGSPSTHPARRQKG